MKTLTGWGRRSAPAALVALFSLMFPATGSLASEPQILGKITDPDGAVVADAMVFLTPVNGPEGARSSPIRTLRSDQKGAFYAALPAGRYRVAAVKSGYDVAMTDIYSRARGVLKLEMTRSPGLFPGRGSPGTTGEDLGSGWILRQQRDNVLRATGPNLDDAAVHLEETRQAVPAAGNEGWAAAMFAPLDGHFAQQFSGGAPMTDDGEAALGRTTGLSIAGALAEDSGWRFNGWSGRTYDEVDDAGNRLENRNNRAAIGVDYRLGGRDTVTGDLWYGARRYMVETGDGMAEGTEQAQRSIALRSRWERQVDGDAALYVEGEFFHTGARLPDQRLADRRIEDRY
jgi:hypothetical protein